MHAKDPHGGHHELLLDLKGRLGKATLSGIRPAEQIAILGQIVGAIIADMDDRQFDVGEIMRALSRNIAAGNSPRAPLVGRLS